MRDLFILKCKAFSCFFREMSSENEYEEAIFCGYLCQNSEHVVEWNELITSKGAK